MEKSSKVNAVKCQCNTGLDCSSSWKDRSVGIDWFLVISIYPLWSLARIERDKNQREMQRNFFIHVSFSNLLLFCECCRTSEEG